MQASSSPGSVEEFPRAERRSRSHGLDRDALESWCERAILGLVLVLLVFEPLGFGGVGVPQTLVLQGVAALVLILWVARIWVAKSYRLLLTPISGAVLLFLVYAVVRYRMLLDEKGVEYVARRN